MWRYYSTERPLTPGAIPRQREVVEVVNYDEPRRLVWIDDDIEPTRVCGYAEYREKLTPKEVEQYELLEVERYDPEEEIPAPERLMKLLDELGLEYTGGER